MTNVEAAIQAAMRELIYTIGEAEQQGQQRKPPTPDEWTALLRRRAVKIVDAYNTGLLGADANTTLLLRRSAPTQDGQ